MMLCQQHFQGFQIEISQMKRWKDGIESFAGQFCQQATDIVYFNDDDSVRLQKRMTTPHHEIGVIGMIQGVVDRYAIEKIPFKIGVFHVADKNVFMFVLRDFPVVSSNSTP